MLEQVSTKKLVFAARLADIKAAGCLALNLDGHALALFAQGDQVYAVDNRCPHMGFPLHRGSVKEGILTCHWHHARFDLASGGTFDPWADDVTVFPTQLRGEDVWVDLDSQVDGIAHHRKRLSDGLERNLSLVIAKAAINLHNRGVPPAEPFQIGLDFGVRYRQSGWGQGLTMLTCFINMMPQLHPEDRPRAVYHGLSAVANDTESMPPRFMLQPLPGSPVSLETLKTWLRSFIEVRDSEGAERCVLSALEAGADTRQMADMLFSAVTDHRYIQIGHPMDFTNKALEALDIAGWEYAAPVLTSLVAGYASASRMEESNAWRHPIDLVEIEARAFDLLPEALNASRASQGKWNGGAGLLPVLLGDNPQDIAEGLLAALRQGCPAAELAGTVAYAAALRIAQFHTSNEFGDWDTALHTFTFANAVHQGLRRSNTPELVRGVFDAAMSVYLDRFLNIPAARLPEPDGKQADAEKLLGELPALLNGQQQVNEAGALIARYLYSGGKPEKLLAMLGRLLLREDRDFHTIQTMEAAMRQYSLLGNTPEGTIVLIAAGRYLAAHAPTVRAQGQTYQIAQRLSQGERLFDDDSRQDLSP